MKQKCNKKEHVKMPRLANGKCRGCNRESASRYRAKHRETLLQKERVRVALDPEKHRTRSREAKRRQLGFPEPRYPMPELCEWPECKRKAVCLDHCHSTNIHRGWLCRLHNQGLGQIGDTMKDLHNGVRYLSRVDLVSL
jgi:hypothetical protein